MSGSSTPCGRLARERVTASFTSLSARSVLVSSRNVIVVTDTPSVMDEAMWRTPSTPETPSSMVLVTWASSSAGAAPNWVTITDTRGMSALGRRVTASLVKLVQPRNSRMMENTAAGSGRRIDQAEPLSAIAPRSLVELFGKDGLAQIAVVQRTASVGYHDITVLEALADLNVGVRPQSRANPSRFDPGAAHHLHAGAVGAI